MNRQQRLAELERRRTEALAGGGAERAAKQHAKGCLTARERVELLLDPGSFNEIGAFVTHRSTDFGMGSRRVTGDGVVAGWGTVDGRLVYLFAQDFTVFGGTMSEANARKICDIMDLAMENGAPVVGLNDSGGARIQEGVASLGGYADVFLRNTLASGVVPQISAILGPCAGGAVYSPAITDFTLMVEGTSHMFVTGPEVIRAVTAEDVTFEDLGGAMTHNTKSGVAHFVAHDDADCLRHVRRLLSFLPSNNVEDPPRRTVTDPVDRRDAELATIVPDASDKPYDMKEVVRRVVDDGEFFEVHEHFAQNLIVGFARLAGRLGGRCRQPAEGARRCARHRFVRQGRALHPLLRRVQHPARDVRGRARLPARHAPGMGRNHPSRREAAVRLLRGDGAQAHGGGAQGLRRRVRRHVEQAHSRRLQRRLAERRDGGDGRRWAP